MWGEHPIGTQRTARIAFHMKLLAERLELAQRNSRYRVLPPFAGKSSADKALCAIGERPTSDLIHDLCEISNLDEGLSGTERCRYHFLRTLSSSSERNSASALLERGNTVQQLQRYPMQSF